MPRGLSKYSFVPREDGEPDDHYECKVIVGEDYFRPAGWTVEYEKKFPVDLAESAEKGDLFQNDKGRNIRNYKVDIFATKKLKGGEIAAKPVEIDGGSHNSAKRKEKDAIRDTVIPEKYKTEKVIRLETTDIICATVQDGRRGKRKKMGPYLTPNEIRERLGI